MLLKAKRKNEDWRMKNPTLNWKEFKFGVNDITAVAPIFDMVKLNDIAKKTYAVLNNM